MFVKSLKYGYYRFQFSQFGWAHMLLLLMVSQAYALVYNIYEGFIWCVCFQDMDINSVRGETFLF